MKYTQIPSTAFEQIQLNAGILLDSFEPATGLVGNIIGATTGGVQFQDSVEYSDFGDDIDNCPKNMMELKKLESHEVTMGGTFVTVSAATAKLLAGASDIDANNSTHVIPRNELLSTDFSEVWWVGDYSDKNTGDSAGYIAIRLMNALNTDGFQIQSTDKGKGQFSFNFMGHYSIEAQDTVPYEIYIKAGGAGSIVLNRHNASVKVGSTLKLSASVYPEDASVTWASDSTSEATVSNGTVTGVAVGTVTITASITVSSVTYTDSCVVTVTSAGA